jgi:N-methylhydantoinase B
VAIVYDSNIFEMLDSGTLPTSYTDVDGRISHPQWKSANLPTVDGDLFEYRFPSMPGYGDPLRRSPDHVAADFDDHRLDEATAARVYGVVFVDGVVDASATVARRLEMRRMRLGDREPREPVEPPSDAQRVGEILHVVDGRWWCNGADLGPAADNYKLKAVQIDRAPSEHGPEFVTRDPEIADHLVLREFICPVTGYRIDTETSLIQDDVLHDIRLW